MSKKKISVFIDWYKPAFKSGGPIKSVHNIIENLNDDFLFYIITSDHDLGVKLNLNESEKNRIIEKSTFNIIYFEKKRRTYRSYLNILKLIKPDIIYVNSLFSFEFSILPIIVGLTLKKPIIIAPRGMLGKGALAIKKIKKKIFLLLLSYSRVYQSLIWHATDEDEKSQVMFHFGQTVKIHVIPNLVSKTPDFVKKIKNRNSLNLFFLSRISEKKNLIYVLELLGKFSNTKALITFTIIGPVESQKYWSKCQDLISKLPTNIKVQAIGSLPSNQIPSYLKNQHLLILPTKHENFGHVIVESWQAGCPVLISKNTPWLDLTSKNLGFDIDLNERNQFLDKICFFTKMNQNEYNKWSYSVFNYVSKFSENKESIHKMRNLLNHY